MYGPQEFETEAEWGKRTAASDPQTASVFAENLRTLAFLGDVTVYAQIRLRMAADFLEAQEAEIKRLKGD